MPIADLLTRPLTRAIFLTFLVLCAVTACKPSAVSPDAVAETDLGMISAAEFEEFILKQPEQRRSPTAGVSITEWRRTMLETMIVARALEEEGRKNGLVETEDGQQLLKNRVQPILIKAAAERMIGDRFALTEEELRSFYDTHPEEFSHPEQIRVRHIYRRVARDAPNEEWRTARNEMEGLVAEIRRGSRFEDLARLHSDSETAPLEGLIGRLDRGKFQPELEELLWSLDEGEVSEVIRTPVGYQVFKVETRLGNFKMDYEDARGRLLRRLTREAVEASEKAVSDELLASSGAFYAPQELLEGQPDDVVFSLDAEALTVAAFHTRLNAAGFASAREIPLRQQADAIVRERLLLWQASASGLADEPELAAQLERVERITMVELARRDRLDSLIERLDDDELWKFYGDRQERFQTPRLLHLQILTRDFPAEVNWYGVFEELAELAKEIRSGEREFADAARDLSTDFSAAAGGDVGLIRPDAITEWAGPQAQKMVLDLTPGQVSDPILIERYNSNRLTYERAGYLLVRMEKIEEPRTRSFDEVRTDVVDLYIEHNRDELQEALRGEILSSVNTKIHPENL